MQACLLHLPVCLLYFSPSACFSIHFYISVCSMAHTSYYLPAYSCHMTVSNSTACFYTHTLPASFLSCLHVCIWSALLRIHVSVPPCLPASASIFIIGLPKSHPPPIHRVLTHRLLPLSMQRRQLEIFGTSKIPPPPHCADVTNECAEPQWFLYSISIINLSLPPVVRLCLLLYLSASAHSLSLKNELLVVFSGSLTQWDRRLEDCSLYKRKCWTNSVVPLYLSLLWRPNYISGCPFPLYMHVYMIF